MARHIFLPYFFSKSYIPPILLWQVIFPQILLWQVIFSSNTTMASHIFLPYYYGKSYFPPILLWHVLCCSHTTIACHIFLPYSHGNLVTRNLFLSQEINSEEITFMVKLALLTCIITEILPKFLPEVINFVCTWFPGSS